MRSFWIFLRKKSYKREKVKLSFGGNRKSMTFVQKGWAKQWMRKKFADWYAEQIREGLDKGLELESIDEKMTLTVMKPLHARWLIELYDIMTSEQGKDVIISGWEVSGISETIKIGLSKLPILDPLKIFLPSRKIFIFVYMAPKV